MKSKFLTTALIGGYLALGGLVYLAHRELDSASKRIRDDCLQIEAKLTPLVRLNALVSVGSIDGMIGISEQEMIEAYRIGLNRDYNSLTDRISNLSFDECSRMIKAVDTKYRKN